MTNSDYSLKVQPVKLLVVDDDAFACDYIENVLSDKGFKVTTDQTGFSLTRLSDENIRPDVILLDVMLGKLSGIELSRHLKANRFTRSIPLVAMSASGDRLSDHPGLVADAYLTKPFNVDELLGLVNQFVNTSCAEPVV